MDSLNDLNRYYVVEGSVLPEVFLKVVRANTLLRSGEAKSATEASKKVGISRSVFYKYKDFIRPFYDKEDKILTIYALLKDIPGVLSSFLSIMATLGANVLTINQNIPINSLAPITISAQTGELLCDVDTLLDRLSITDGVVSVDIIAKN